MKSPASFSALAPTVSTTLPSSETSGGVPLDLNVGDRISATVLEATDPGSILIGLRGLKVKAQAEVLLQEGKTYLFSIVQTGEILKLALLHEESTVSSSQKEFQGKLAKLLARGGLSAFPRNLKLLKGALRNRQGPLYRLLDRLSQWPKSAQEVKRLFSGLGLEFESRLLKASSHESGKGHSLLGDVQETLKPLLLGETQMPAEEDAKNVLKATLDSLEGLQGENIQRMQLGGGRVFPLPLVPGVKSGEVYLFPPADHVEEDKEEKGESRERGGGKQPFRVVFILDFERLGPLRVDLELVGPDLHALVRCSNEQSASLIARELDHLRQGLEAVGLKPLYLQARAARAGERIGRPESADSANEPMSLLDCGYLVDVKG